MYKKMHPNFVHLLCTVITLFVSASTKELTTNYIDLLDLSVNYDEFLWDDLQKIQSSYRESFRFNASERSNDALHSVRKRQVQQGDDAILQESKDFGTCSTPDGESGHCRHIVYCRMPELKNDVWRVVSQLCIIKGSSIGICCPDNISNRIGPQIINDKNDNGPVVNHPEQRGCGIATKQFSRATVARSAEPDEWPWMAAFFQPGIPYVVCGGSLVTDRLVLTAAHCVYKEDKDSFTVRLGEYDTKLLNETRARNFRVSSMITHEDYDPNTYENDIALVRVDRPTLFNTYIWPVCLPPIGEDWEGYGGVVTGWGAKFFSGPHSETLMEVAMPVWNHDICKDSMIERVTDTMLCAGSKTGGQDSCQGDSGGPLMVQLPNKRWVIIGIVSWGVSCGTANRPGVYTRIDKYLHWIFNNSNL